MKTVQEYFMTVNADMLINHYLYDHPVNLNDVSDDNQMIGDVKKHIRTVLKDYIERLRSVDIEKNEDGKEYILFVHKIQSEGVADDSYSLVCLQELREEGVEAQTYSYIFDRQAKIMGFKVSDAKYTQKNIIGLLADVMHEASFFGFEQQRLEEELERLEISANEVKEGKAKTYTMEEVWEHLGLEREEKDETADELQRVIWKATMEYDQYQKKKEMQALLDCI